MNAQRDKGTLLVHLNVFEGRLLHRILGIIAENYKVRPEDIDSQTAEAWYSARGCRAAKMSADETRDWLAALHQVKQANLARIQEWSAALAGVKPAGYSLRLDLGAAEAFMTAINDYRLMAAARHDITEAEMDFGSEREVANLPPARRAALMEIHLLAWLLEEILAALNGS